MIMIPNWEKKMDPCLQQVPALANIKGAMLGCLLCAALPPFAAFSPRCKILLKLHMCLFQGARYLSQIYSEKKKINKNPNSEIDFSFHPLDLWPF